MISKTDFYTIDDRIKKITEQKVEQIEISSDLPPTVEQLEDNNKTYAIMAAILFIDIRKSTYLTENSQTKSMVKIYRSFMRMAVDCVRKNGGVTRQFLGDRIMGVFIDTICNGGVVVESAVDKAVNCSRSLLTLIDFSLNKHLKSNVNGKIIECGIGIDYGKVLVTQVGMYGVENDENKADETDTVWVGNTTNYASKYSDIADGGEIFISKVMFAKLSADLKPEDMWTKSVKSKGNKLYEGFVAKEYYLDFIEELGEPITAGIDNTSASDTANQLVLGIEAIEKLQEKLIKREKEISLLETELKQENERLKKHVDLTDKQYHSELEKRQNIESNLHDVLVNYYDFILELLRYSHCKSEFINQVGLDYWDRIIKEFYHVGNLLEYSDIEITSEIDHALVGIYSFFSLHEKAYEAMVFMATHDNYWVNIKQDVLQWAKENNVLFKIITPIQQKLDNYEIEYKRQKDFQQYLDTIKKIRGY